MRLHLKAEGKDDRASEFGGQVLTFGEFKRRMAQVSSLPLATLRIKVGDPPEFVDYPDSTPLANTLISADCSVYAVGARDISRSVVPGEAPANPTAKRTPCDCKGCAAKADAHNSCQEQPRPGPAGSLVPRSDYIESSSEIADWDTSAFVAFRDGYLVRRTVPSDNSCLFRALCHALGQPSLNPKRLRELVCHGILNNPELYSEAVLEKPAAEYCQWISQSTSWGGGIEMAILSETFSVEICSIDIQSLRTDRFGEGSFARRVILLYSDIHYDYVAFASSANAPRGFDQTEFGVVSGVDGDAILAAAVGLAAALRNR
ncbi:ubiquitin-specific protease otu1 [Coemansia sp. BCRC 34301]|nr:ubiquitin-specific protease otu1 [Coemansia sp. BCRC 34301]